MKRHLLYLALTGGLMLAAVPYAAGQELRREGQFWVETVTGKEAVSPGGALRITTLGPVGIKGAAQESVTYVLNKKVRAPNEADARRQLNQFVLKTSREGAVTTFRVAHGTGTADLRVIAPRTLESVRVETHGGSVEASDMNGSVRVETGGGPIKLDRIGGEVVARTAGGEVALDEIGGGVRCESAGGNIRARVVRSQINCGTAGGEISIQEAGGPVRVSTAGGNIRIVRAASTVDADTSGGSIDIGKAQAMVRAETGGGSIDVGAANGVRCESGGGGIRLNNVTGSVRASTSVGAVLARLLAGGNLSDGFLSTGGGDITVFIPSNLAVTIRAQNAAVAQGARRIVSDFDEVNVRVEGPLVIGEGSINGGGPVLRLAGTGGTIYIRRQR